MGNLTNHRSLFGKVSGKFISEYLQISNQSTIDGNYYYVTLSEEPGRFPDVPFNIIVSTSSDRNNKNAQLKERTGSSIGPQNGEFRVDGQRVYFPSFYAGTSFWFYYYGIGDIVEAEFINGLDDRVTFLEGSTGVVLGGNDTNIQYNQGGVFGGKDELSFDYTTNTLSTESIKITSGSPSVGKVLTAVDSSGLATWEESTGGGGNSNVINVNNEPGTTFNAKLQSAIDNASDGNVLDCTEMTGNWSQDAPITIDKPLRIILGFITVSFDNAIGENMFNIESDTVRIEGQGRSPNSDDLTGPSKLIMLNSSGDSSTGFHVYSRGYNVISIDSLDMIGIQSSQGTQVGSASPPNGSGGIYMEKETPGVTTGGNNVSQVSLTNLYIQGTKWCGIYIDTPILTYIFNVRVSAAGGHGFFLNGGTSCTLLNCYASSANWAGFCIYQNSYSSMYSCASESAGVAYWIRSSNSISMFSCGGESLLNKGLNPWSALAEPGMKISTLGAGAVAFDINDIGNDFSGLFRGHGLVITGGRNISAYTPFFVNINGNDGSGQSTTSRFIYIAGNARANQIILPRLTLTSGYTSNHRFDIGIQDDFGDTPRDNVIQFNPEDDGTVTPATANRFVTFTNTSGDQSVVLDRGINTNINWGGKLFYQDFYGWEPVNFSGDWTGDLRLKYDMTRNVLRLYGIATSVSAANSEVFRAFDYVPSAAQLAFGIVLDSNGNKLAVRYDTSALKRLLFIDAITPSRSYFFNLELILGE